MDEYHDVLLLFAYMLWFNTCNHSGGISFLLYLNENEHYWFKMCLLVFFLNESENISSRKVKSCIYIYWIDKQLQKLFDQNSGFVVWRDLCKERKQNREEKCDHLMLQLASQHQKAKFVLNCLYHTLRVLI